MSDKTAEHDWEPASQSRHDAERIKAHRCGTCRTIREQLGNFVLFLPDGGTWTRKDPGCISDDEK